MGADHRTIAAEAADVLNEDAIGIANEEALVQAARRRAGWPREDPESPLTF